MLIDNKTVFQNNPKTIVEFLRRYLKEGNLDLVTGYFTVSMLSFIYENHNEIEYFRMVLGNMIKDNIENDKIIDLLNEQSDFRESLSINKIAKNAVAFLEQDKVNIKTVRPNFCHAKSYIFESKEKDPQKSFYILGSSNLTEAGFGLRTSSNVELNTANFASTSDYGEVREWFNNLWKNPEAKSVIKHDGEKIDFKNYLIDEITKLYKEYTPEQLYYKVLFELFKDELVDIEPNSFTQKQIEFLKDTIVYNTLYPFQQKGVISLIKKIQRYNGAILADAVGLGKTWQALAVIKYFELQGYEVVVLCPKKLSSNWSRYLKRRGSKFERDQFDFVVRYHTDLQDERLNKDDITLEGFFIRKPKMLYVIDESHNLRNDKSNRYQFLVENLFKFNKDVKVLLLSATPINTKLTDVRNQFKLIARGNDDGYEGEEFEIPSLQSLFANAQREFNDWQEGHDRKIADFIKALPQKFFDLTDALIVARTREIIKRQDTEGVFNFPEKEKPINEYIEIKNLGNFSSFDEILDALKINFTAYRPAEYSRDGEIKSVLEDEKQRQKFLAKMMYILLIKRLESSWFSFRNTVNNILNHHVNALDKVETYIERKGPDEFSIDFDENTKEELEDNVDQYITEQDENNTEYKDLTLGKKHPIHISSITQIENFKKHLSMDIRKLKRIKKELDAFDKKVSGEIKTKENHISVDSKLEKLISVIKAKRKKGSNPKVVIFSVYKDTVKYLYEQFRARGFNKIAYVAGGEWDADIKIKGESNKDFEHLLERFAPYTKLFHEKDWSDYYIQQGIQPLTEFHKWKTFISILDKKTAGKLDNPIDILIATDCLSEGQNLQDCDFVVNYDIHWNPVRIIQRMGRIDRLASPNNSITGVNFWPAKNYEDFLRLKSRVENRMALLSVVGSEIDNNITPSMSEITADNPLISIQEQKMLEQLQLSWEDIEENKEILGFDKLSLETFRQELYELFQQKRKELESIPNGVFTGFAAKPDLFINHIRKGLIALIGYPKKDPFKKDFKYERLHLLFTDSNDKPTFINDIDLLTILRKHKLEARLIPDEIDNNDKAALDEYAGYLNNWLKWKSKQTAVKDVQDLFKFGITEKTQKNKTKVEEIYKPENFDLITWFIIS